MIAPADHSRRGTDDRSRSDRPPTDDNGSPLAPTALVCGGGPGGAATALLLAAIGYEVTLLERQAAPAAVGGALLLQPNGLAVLTGLGLGPDLAGCRRVATSAIHDRKGRTLLEAPVHPAGPGLDENVVVRRSHLFALLHERLAADPRIDVRLGHVARSTDGRTIEISSPGGTERMTADLVVVADGARSALRSTLVPEARIDVVEGPTYVRAIVPGPVPGGAAGEWWTSLGLFGAIELDDGTSYVFASAAHPDLADALERDDVASFAARWADELPLAAELLGRVTDAADLMVNRADEVHASTWVTDRAALLGDAAHAMLPNSGQGANSALVDAAVLAMELARDHTIDAALQAYDRRRRPAVTVAQDDARRLARLAHATSGPARVARNLLLRTAAHLPTGRQARRLYQEDPAQLRDRCSSLVRVQPRPWSRSA